MIAKPCTLGKLFRAYEKAEHELVMRRNEEFPIGTKVEFAGMEALVISGSLYPHQILTTMGHTSWRFAKKITNPNPALNVALYAKG